MKYWIILFLAVIIASCKTVQVINVTGTNLEEGKYLVYENDSVKITYDLWYHRGLISFSVFNKLDVPLYIDWKKCSYISNSNKFNYWDDIEESSEVAFYQNYLYLGPQLVPGHYSEHSLTKGTVSSKRLKPERVTFVPPKSHVYKSRFLVLPTRAINMDSEEKQSAKASWSENSNKMTNIKKRSFSGENTLVFRNFLTFSTTEKFENEFYVDNEFRVNEVIEMSEKQFKGKTKSLRSGLVCSCPYRKASSFYFYSKGKPVLSHCN